MWLSTARQSAVFHWGVYSLQKYVYGFGTRRQNILNTWKKKETGRCTNRKKVRKRMDIIDKEKERERERERERKM